MNLGTASAISRRVRQRRRRSERLRASERAPVPNHQQDVDIIDEAFAIFTRVDSPVAHDGDETGENDGKFPADLTGCLFAQLNALERQRNELVQLLRRIDRES